MGLVNRTDFPFSVLRGRGDGMARLLFFRCVDIDRDDDRNLSFETKRRTQRSLKQFSTTCSSELQI
jgi:hypothetical protein